MINLYVKDKGIAPGTLDDLCPAYLKKVPVDLFSGKPFKYERTDAGWKLWSVGVNLKDDGGVHQESPHATRQSDIVFPEHLRTNVEARSGSD